jgi:DNA-binding LacI/PurR family transcriptional regulator
MLRSQSALARRCRSKVYQPTREYFGHRAKRRPPELNTGGHRDNPTIHSEIRKKMLLARAAELNLAIKDEWCINVSFNRLDDNNRADIRRIFTQDERPTAVMFSSLYTSAMLVISELKSLGLRLPEDVSIIGFDDPAWASCTEPPITVIKQPLEEIGCRAVKMLLSQLEGKIYTRREILKDELIERESIAQI